MEVKRSDMVFVVVSLRKSMYFLWFSESCNMPPTNESSNTFTELFKPYSAACYLLKELYLISTSLHFLNDVCSVPDDICA